MEVLTMKHKQGSIIYFTCGVGNLDHTIDVEEDIQTFNTEEKALNNAKEITSEYGMRTYVYKCYPIIKVDRGKLRITKLTN